MNRTVRCPQTKRVACIGGANVDRKARALQPVQLGTSNPVRVSQFPGGVARNIAENLARLGVAVSLFTVVGEDSEGTWLLNETKRCGIHVRLLRPQTGLRTGTYTAVLDASGELVLALADMDIYDHVRPEDVESCWPHLAASDWIVLDANLPAAVLAAVIERCRETGLPLAVNPVSAVKAIKLPERLHGVDVLFPNRDEAEALTGMPVQSVDDGLRACERLLARGAKRVALTLGSQGVVWATTEESGHLLPETVPVIDVTGAGDALVAGVIFGLVHDAPFPTACRLGMAAAALTLQSERSVAELTAQQVYAALVPDNHKEA